MNSKFSLCSETSIGQVLAMKKTPCFKEMTSLTKGNFERDDDENCDAGTLGGKCCTSDQKCRAASNCNITNESTARTAV